jgi:hypothetical protein
MEELSKLTFLIVLHIPVLDSRYNNSVVSQATMWYSVTPTTRICWKIRFSKKRVLFVHSQETGQKRVRLALSVCKSLEFRAGTTQVQFSNFQVSTQILHRKPRLLNRPRF